MSVMIIPNLVMIHQTKPKEMPAELGKVLLNKEFVTRIYIFRGQLPYEHENIGRKWTIM